MTEPTYPIHHVVEYLTSSDGERYVTFRTGPSESWTFRVRDVRLVLSENAPPGGVIRVTL